jgi:DNA gyrase inhibitor GyrI
VPKPAGAQRTVDGAQAEIAAAPVKKVVETVKRAIPEVQPRTGMFAALGTLAAVGGAFFIWRASRAEEPAYQTIESDGPIEIRKYPALVTAATEARGERQAALSEGFRTLADYLFARSRSGAKLPMTAPVLADSEGDGRWRTRFVMPAGRARATLPPPPPGVELTSEPARRVAAMRFTGRVDDATLDAKEGALRSWLQIRGLPSEGKAMHAFYNAPFTPGAFRRNEVMIALSDEGGTGA